MQNLRNKLIAGGAVVMLAAIGTVMNRPAARADNTVPAQDGGSRRTPVTATYTLDSDCTGTFTFVPGMPGWELVVTSDGKEGRTLNLNEGTIGTRSFERR